jgi:pyrroline-5-carboxylate reductase
MSYSIGFIGGGNMAGAIVKGLVGGNIYSENEIIVSVLRSESLERIKTELGVDATLVNSEVAEKSKIVILAVKPHFIVKVLEEISPVLTEDHLVISIAAGITLDQMKSYTGKAKLFRAMPNTPAAVNAAMTSICSDLPQNDPVAKIVYDIFSAIGRVEFITEAQIHAAIAVHGSSPAYAFMMMEAMGDAGVLLGLPRDQAYRMAAQSLYGAALMMLESGKHPGALKDQVTSPGGTTIVAVASLEEQGFRNAVIDSMRKCADKSKEMSS